MLEVLLHEQISIYCKYYFSLNHLSRTTHHIFILLFHIFGCLNPDLALKAENPIEKHLADSNLFDYTKILTVAGVGMHIRPEAVNHGVHKTIIADEFYFNAWRVIHPECRLDILVHIKAHRLRHSRLIQNLRLFCDSVNSVTSNALVFIRIADNIIKIAVPDKRIWAECVLFTIVMQHNFLANILLSFLKTNFSAMVDCLVDYIDNIENLLILWFDSSVNGKIALEFSALEGTGE